MEWIFILRSLWGALNSFPTGYPTGIADGSPVFAAAVMFTWGGQCLFPDVPVRRLMQKIVHNAGH